MENTQHLVSLGDLWPKIDTLLRQKNMTANQLSHMVGYNDNGQIYALKNGKIKNPSFLMICRIADALGVSTDDLRPDKEGKGSNDK